MELHFINVGYGEAILIKEDNFHILIDGGTNRPEEYAPKGCINAADYLENLGVSRIDIAIITHIHDDHISGMVQILDTFEIGQIWINMLPQGFSEDKVKEYEEIIKGGSGELFVNALSSYVKIVEIAKRKNISITEKGSENIEQCCDSKITINMLNPNKELQNRVKSNYLALSKTTDPNKIKTLISDLDLGGNETSMALHIAAEKSAFILTADLTSRWEQISSTEELKADILKVAHHGQVDGLPDELLQAAAPSYYVICGSKDRRYQSSNQLIIDKAKDFTRSQNKEPYIFITGALDENFDDCLAAELCSVVFKINCSTNEIAHYFMSIDTNSQNLIPLDCYANRIAKNVV